MRQQLKRNLIATAVFVAVQSMSGLSIAENDGGQLSLEEIIVTAQKREQTLQDVPSTVNALSGDALSDLKLFNFSDIEQLSPGLDLRSVDSRAGAITLRGVDFNPNTAASPAVDVYWNGTTLGVNASSGVFQEMYDIGRIEILRGSQGTLQGRTSPAGAVAIHTAKPDMYEVEGYVRSAFSNNSGFNTQVASSLPIVPGELSIRIAGVYNESELDEIKNYLDGDVSDTQTKSSRLTLTWLPSDAFSAEMAYQYLETDLSTYSVLTGSSRLGQSMPALSASAFTGIATKPDDFSARYENVSLNINWDVWNHQLTLVTGYSEVDSVRDFEFAQGNSQVGFVPVPGQHEKVGFSGTQLDDPQAMFDRNYNFSQEIRIASSEGGFWDYTVGLYYGSESGFFKRSLVQENQVPMTPTSIFADTQVRALFESKNYGVFWHNILYLNDRWTAQAGVRWQKGESKAHSSLYLAEDLTGINPAWSEDAELISLLGDDFEKNSYEALTGSVSLQYDLESYDSVAYMSASTSFRPGGVTIAPYDLRELTQYNEEDSWTIEFGLKSNLWDGRLRLNTAVFYQDYSDYIGRVNSILLYNGAVEAITTNGDARVQGVELDFELLLTESWHLSGGVSYTEAEYKDGVKISSNECAIQPGQTTALCDVSGQELGSQPPFSANLNSEYLIPLDNYETYIRGSYRFTGRRTDPDAPSGDLGGYGTLDLHFGLRDSSDTWEVSLYARNLFDKNTTKSINAEYQTLGALKTGYQKAVQISPRVIGVSAEYKF